MGTKTYKAVFLTSSILSLTVFLWCSMFYQKEQQVLYTQDTYKFNYSEVDNKRYGKIASSLDDIQRELSGMDINSEVLDQLQTNLKEIESVLQKSKGHKDGSVNSSNETYSFGDDAKHSHDDTRNAEFLFDHVKVLCWIPASNDTLHSRGIHVMNTWGKRCNKLIFFTPDNVDDFPTIALDLMEKGSYDLTIKVYTSLYYLFEHYIHDYDWFLKADTDSYVIVENLRYMLMEYDPNQPVYFGQHFMKFVKNGYMSGGAGYVLSKRALHRFGVRGYNTSRCETKSGIEDLSVGRCMQNIGVEPGDSRDSENRTRFHCMNPGAHVHGKYPDWFRAYDKFGAKQGIDSLSDYAISFHWLKIEDMYNLEYFVYHLRPYGIISGPQDLNRKSLVQKKYSIYKTVPVH